jgi:cytoskeletal protein RodZ
VEPEIAWNIGTTVSLLARAMQSQERKSMNNRYLISVAAAALIAGTGFANAQGTGTSREAPSSGAATQQSPSAAPPNRDASQSGAPAETPKAAQSKDMAPKGEKSAQDNMKGPAAKDMKADSKGPADSKGTADNKAGSTATDNKTTGNAATSATAAPPAEKRTQITSAIKSEKIQETTNVNFNIAVGATIPASVRFHPLPARIVEIYPEWRGYEVVYVRGRYIIVRPQTHEIVYIIEG